jgi:hypothetical protein
MTGFDIIMGLLFFLFIFTVVYSIFWGLNSPTHWKQHNEQETLRISELGYDFADKADKWREMATKLANELRSPTNQTDPTNSASNKILAEFEELKKETE